MAETQPVLILDTTAVLTTQLSLWQDWDRWGQCVLPQAVMAELNFLTQRAEDPAQEATAREFLRFIPTSDYWISTAQALVSQGQAEDPSLSKRARLEQAVAECAYALSQQQVGTLVVLISQDRGLVNRITHLQISNLCAISAPELLQWQRQHHRPTAVDRALTLMPGPPIPASVPTQGQPASKYTPRSGMPTPAPTPPRPTASALRQPSRSLSRPAPQSSPRQLHPLLLTLQILFNFGLVVASLSLLTASGLVAWRVADREGSEAVWQWLQLPEIPYLYPNLSQEGP